MKVKKGGTKGGSLELLMFKDYLLEELKVKVSKELLLFRLVIDQPLKVKIYCIKDL
jgi:hypothetical protein